MSKLVTNDVTGGYADVTAINDNNALIEAAVENTLSLDGTTPNSMSADFDMDSNNILNANTVSADAVQIGGVSVVPGDTLVVPTAASVPNVAAGNIVATDVQSAINELDGEKMKVIATPVTNDLVLQAADGELSKAGYGLPNVNADVIASDEELNYSVGVTSAIQTQLNTLTTDVATIGYEEGVWTPDLQDGNATPDSATMDYSVGTYEKIGRVVYFRGKFKVSSLGAIDGFGMRIAGLPYTSNSTINSDSAVYCSVGNGLAITAGTTIAGYVQPNKSLIILTLWNAATGTQTLSASNLTATTELTFSGSYYV